MGLVAEVFGVYAERGILGFSPVVVLRAEDGRILPIYIGISEAVAIHSALKNEIPPRPMTHDLLVEIIRRLDAKVERVIIDDMIDNIFYARLILSKNGQEIEVDARPSDSIAIAVRLAVPIYIDEKVLDEACRDELPEDFVDFDEVL